MSGKAESFQLTPRLAEVAKYIRSGKRVVDIGTDHAYLPIWLITSGRCPKAIATDLRDGPLAHASTNAYKYRVQTKLSLRRCDGLAGVAPDEVDDIVIAGMGGELIARILKQAEWVKSPAYNLVLQAMSSAEDLRKYLREEGFEIKTETAVRDGNHIYTVINAVYTGVTEPEKDVVDYLGKLDINASAEAREYAERQLRHLNNRMQGLMLGQDKSGLEKLQNQTEALKSLLGGGE